uniref:Uncharacterized protein n=1 Tax=Oryza glumipatula TaxID=40148 RepID=A0A0E0BG53_9ORYZ
MVVDVVVDGDGGIGTAAAAVPDIAGAILAVGSGGAESPVILAFLPASVDAVPAVIVALADQGVPRRAATLAGVVSGGPSGVAAHAAALVGGARPRWSLISTFLSTTMDSATGSSTPNPAE